LPWIPARSETAETGSEFAHRTGSLQGRERQIAAADALKSGNIPDFIRTFVPITVTHSPDGKPPIEIVFWVMPDYLSIGCDSDFLRIPLSFVRAVEIARQFHCVLPTRRMVDIIHENATCKLTPQPLPPGPRMRSCEYYLRHQALVETQWESRGCVPGELTSGHKKDVVLTNRLFRKIGREAIYGWHDQNSVPIQPLSTIHGERYADYSHGVRLIYDRVLVNGQEQSIYTVMKDPELAPALTYEGFIAGLRDLMKR